MNVQTCRACKLTNYEHSEPLLKYGVRHYMHGSCGINRFGPKFLDMIPRHQITQLPYRLVQQHGLSFDELVAKSEGKA
jgi:hypothetical protein